MKTRRTRREFFVRASAAIAGIATSGHVWSSEHLLPLTHRASDVQIGGATLRDETIRRYGGIGDIFPLTWLADGQQFSSFSDGFGWNTRPAKYFNTRVFSINGGPVNPSFQEIASYPDLSSLPSLEDSQRYYGFSVLAVGNTIYQLFSRPQLRPTAGGPLPIWNGVKVIYSADRGRTWHNADGSTPVVWESKSMQSNKTLLFLDDPQQSFSLISLLQMGPAYRANKDGYVYGYGVNGNVDGLMNQLVMFRVPADRFLDRQQYEFFGRLKAGGRAIWVKEVEARGIVHIFPKGWVNRKGFVVQSWLPNVVYNAPLDLYLMVSSGIGCSGDGEWSKPSYLGFWFAKRPWGPWTQFYEDTAWAPGGNNGARCYSPQISPKWISPEGKFLWMIWSDYQVTDQDKYQQAVNTIDKAASSDDWMRVVREWRESQPYYGLNSQQVELLGV